MPTTMACWIQVKISMAMAHWNPPMRPPWRSTTVKPRPLPREPGRLLPTVPASAFSVSPTPHPRQCGRACALPCRPMYGVRKTGSSMNLSCLSRKVTSVVIRLHPLAVRTAPMARLPVVVRPYKLKNMLNIQLLPNGFANRTARIFQSTA